MKFKCIVVYENNSAKFDIGHCQIKVKVPFSAIHTAIQTVRSYNLTLVQERKVICSYNNNTQYLSVSSCLNYFTNS